MNMNMNTNTNTVMPISTPITSSVAKPELLKLLTLAEFFKRFPPPRKFRYN